MKKKDNFFIHKIALNTVKKTRTADKAACFTRKQKEEVNTRNADDG